MSRPTNDARWQLFFISHKPEWREGRKTEIGSQWWVSEKRKTNVWWKILSVNRSPGDRRVVKRQLLPTISGVSSEKNFTLTQGHGQRSHTHLRQQVVTGPKPNSVFLKCSAFITATVIILHAATRTNTSDYSQHFSPSSALRTAFLIKWYIMQPRSLY